MDRTEGRGHVDDARWQQTHWQATAADKNGNFVALAPGTYVYIAVPADTQRIMILEAAGHGIVLVNGEPRTGDPYGYGYVHLPVLLHAGVNDFLFQAAHGSFHAQLVPPRHDTAFDQADTTIPDLVIDEAVATWAAVPIVNAATRTSENLWLTATFAGGARCAHQTADSAAAEHAQDRLSH